MNSSRSGRRVARFRLEDLVALGNEDGLGILPDLRSEPSLAGVAIVAFTAHDSRRQEALDQGVDVFLQRPFSSVDLSSTVEAHLVIPPA